MAMESPSDLNRVLLNFDSVSCSHENCKTSMGLRHKDIPQVNFCSIECFKDFHPQTQAFPVHTAGTDSEQHQLYAPVEASPQAESQKNANTIYYQQSNTPALNQRQQSPVEMKEFDVKVTRPLANNSANTFFPKNHQKNVETTSQVKQEAAGKAKTVYYQQQKPAKVEVCKPVSAQQQSPSPLMQPSKNKIIRTYKKVTSHPGPSALKSYGNFFDINIGSIDSKRITIRSHYNSMTDIYFHTPEMQDLLGELQEDIQRLIDLRLLTELDDIKMEDFCIAPYEGDFYRGIIRKVEEDQVHVFFIDFGNEEIVSKEEEIYVLPDSLRKIPRLANHGQWDLALSKEVSNDKLLEMYNDESLNTNVIKKITDGQYLIRIGDKAPKMKFLLAPETIKDPELVMAYEEEFPVYP